MSDYIEKLGKSNLLIEGSLMVGYLVSVFSKDMRIMFASLKERNINR